ncbi:CPBP family intramembrane metalloprotease [Haloarcula sp. S1CR25-12]|uniref:CPBP family intramembrane metalloprotease n=1 Tax=Haloarcula saliterrae TaxID=2950534 RepID=A0ABU2FDJ2_9EURY|nr:type II CAAX endopeptidase family protein [Haloarcula sp. S1CR25-12]MDS0260013.1 CPBP family intramembrane metalloprotease [Haloarcula sp. S1CR25-12]
MSRSDLITEVRGYLVNPAEKRLRAPWRISLWVFLFAFAGVLITAVNLTLPMASRSGPLAALYAMARQVGLILAAVAAGVGIGYLLDRRSLADYGLSVDGQWWRDAGFGVALGFALPTAVLLAQLAVGFTTITGALPTGPSDTFYFAGTGAVLRLALLVPFFVVQASTEEIIVRGYLLTNLAEGAAGLIGKAASTVAATVLTGALFGVLHWTNPNATLLSVGNITLYGLLLGACYVLTGRLGIACGFHVAWNYTLALWDFPVSGLDVGVALVGTRTTGPELVTGGGFGPEGGLVALPILALGSGALYWWVRREYGRVEILDAIAVPDLRIPTRGGE